MLLSAREIRGANQGPKSGVFRRGSGTDRGREREPSSDSESKRARATETARQREPGAEGRGKRKVRQQVGDRGVTVSGRGSASTTTGRARTPSRTVSFSRTMSRWESNTSGEGPCIYVTSAQDPPIGSMPSPKAETMEEGGAGESRRDPSNRNRVCECTQPGPRATESARAIAVAPPPVAALPRRPEFRVGLSTGGSRVAPLSLAPRSWSVWTAASPPPGWRPAHQKSSWPGSLPLRGP
jgi:hypothetical protein